VCGVVDVEILLNLMERFVSKNIVGLYVAKVLAVTGSSLHNLQK